MTEKNEGELRRLADIQASYSAIIRDAKWKIPERDELIERLQRVEAQVDMMTDIRRGRFHDGG